MRRVRIAFVIGQEWRVVDLQDDQDARSMKIPQLLWIDRVIADTSSRSPGEHTGPASVLQRQPVKVRESLGELPRFRVDAVAVSELLSRNQLPLADRHALGRRQVRQIDHINRFGAGRRQAGSVPGCLDALGELRASPCPDHEPAP